MMFDVSSIGGNELIENPLTDYLLVMRCTPTEAPAARWVDDGDVVSGLWEPGAGGRPVL
jgi:hypothetical protein